MGGMPHTGDPSLNHPDCKNIAHNSILCHCRLHTQQPEALALKCKPSFVMFSEGFSCSPKKNPGPSLGCVAFAEPMCCHSGCRLAGPLLLPQCPTLLPPQAFAHAGPTAGTFSTSSHGRLLLGFQVSALRSQLRIAPYRMPSLIALQSGPPPSPPIPSYLILLPFVLLSDTPSYLFVCCFHIPLLSVSSRRAGVCFFLCPVLSQHPAECLAQAGALHIPVDGSARPITSRCRL